MQLINNFSLNQIKFLNKNRFEKSNFYSNTSIKQNYNFFNSSLVCDTISFSGNTSARKTIEKYKNPDFNINGQKDISRRELLDVYRYFGWEEIDKGDGSSHREISSPYSSVTLTNKNPVDPNAAAAVIRAVKMADRTNGELFITRRQPSEKDIEEFCKRTAVKKNTITKNDGSKLTTRNLYREELEKRQQAKDSAKEQDFDCQTKYELKRVLSESLEYLNHSHKEAKETLAELFRSYETIIQKPKSIITQKDIDAIFGKINSLKAEVHAFKQQDKNIIEKSEKAKKADTIVELQKNVSQKQERIDNLNQSIETNWSNLIALIELDDEVLNTKDKIMQISSKTDSIEAQLRAFQNNPLIRNHLNHLIADIKKDLKELKESINFINETFETYQNSMKDSPVQLKISKNNKQNTLKEITEEVILLDEKIQKTEAKILELKKRVASASEKYGTEDRNIPNNTKQIFETLSHKISGTKILQANKDIFDLLIKVMTQQDFEILKGEDIEAFERLLKRKVTEISKNTDFRQIICAINTIKSTNPNIEEKEAEILYKKYISPLSEIEIAALKEEIIKYCPKLTQSETETLDCLLLGQKKYLTLILDENTDDSVKINLLKSLFVDFDDIEKTDYSKDIIKIFNEKKTIERKLKSIDEIDWQNI